MHIYIYIYTKIYINIFKHKVYVYHLGVWLRVHLGGRIAQVHTSDCQSSTDHVNVKAPTWQPGQFVRGGMPMGLAMLYPREWDWEVCNGTSASWHRLVKGSSEKHPGGSNYVTGQDPHFGFDCWQVCKNPNKGAPVEPKLTLVCYLVWWCFVFLVVWYPNTDTHPWFSHVVSTYPKDQELLGHSLHLEVWCVRMPQALEARTGDCPYQFQRWVQGSIQTRNRL